MSPLLRHGESVQMTSLLVVYMDLAVLARGETRHTVEKIWDRLCVAAKGFRSKYLNVTNSLLWVLVSDV